MRCDPLALIDSDECMSYLFGDPVDSTLLYKASRDGWDAIDFHKLVDGVEGTLVIVKNSLGRVFGGFTDVAWSSENVGNIRGVSNSFLFYFEGDELFKLDH